MKAINTSSAEQANLDKFKAKINGWITSIGLPYHLDDLTPDGGIYTIFCPVVWKGLYSAHELKTALKQDVDAEKINIEYIDFKRLIPPKQPLYTTLHAEQPSEEFEKEILNTWGDNQLTKWTKFPYVDFKNIAAHFAQWQKEQIMKSAIEVKINRDTLYNLKPIIHEKYQDLKIGDKILIIKEDKQ